MTTFEEVAEGLFYAMYEPDFRRGLKDALAEAWDTGHAAAKGYDLSYELDRQEWEEEFALIRTTNPYREGE